MPSDVPWIPLMVSLALARCLHEKFDSLNETQSWLTVAKTLASRLKLQPGERRRA